jgi:hypothetical protein
MLVELVRGEVSGECCRCWFGMKFQGNVAGVNPAGYLKLLSYFHRHFHITELENEN